MEQTWNCLLNLQLTVFTEIFASAKSLSKKYRDGCKALEAKYGPKVSREKTEEELQRVYDQWWDDHEILTAGENITLKDIEEAVDSINTPLRWL